MLTNPILQRHSSAESNAASSIVPSGQVLSTSALPEWIDSIFWLKIQQVLLFSLLPAIAMFLWLDIADPLNPTLSAAFHSHPIDLQVVLVHCAAASLSEELIFRCLLFLGLHSLLIWKGCPARSSLLCSMLASSLLFALAHEQPETWLNSPLLFTYRMGAGVYLSTITWTCGLSVAAGTHFCFNLALLLACG